MNKKLFSAFIVFSAVGLAAAVFALRGEAQAAVCSLNPPSGASVIWSQGGGNVSSINKGEDATETWSVSGATAASGECTGGGTRPDGTKVVTRSSVPKGGLSLGPQSFKFEGIQDDITCTVYGYVDSDDTPDCEYSATVRVNQTPTPTPAPMPTPTPPSGGERCYFDDPGNFVGGAPTQSANYTATVNADICAAAQTTPNPTCAGNLHWTTANGPAWNAPPLDSSYKAFLNGGSFNNKPVSLSDGLTLARAELLQNNTYKLTVQKNGANVTRCSVTFNAVVPTTPPIQPLKPGVFPGQGTYSLNTSVGTISAAYNYAPQISAVLISLYNPLGSPGSDYLSSFLGQFKKAVYFVLGHEPGEVGKWDLSDPFNPSGPVTQFIGREFDGRTNGPVDCIWGHASHGIGAAVEENADGDARVLNRDGLVPGCAAPIVGTDSNGYPIVGTITAPASVPQGFSVESFSGNSASFGQQIDSSFGNAVPSSGLAAMSVFAASGGNFFGYQAVSGKVNIFDLTDLPGNADPPFMKPSGSISWQNVMNIHITNIPGRDSQFIIAQLGDANTSSNGISITKPIYKIGKLNNGTGKVVSQKTVNFNVTSGNRFSPSNIQSVTVNGAAYILLIEKIGGGGNLSGMGDMTIGAYKFTPDDMSITRIGSITAKNATLSSFGTGSFRVMSSVSDSVYPLIAVPAQASAFKSQYGLDIYNSKDLFTVGGDLAPQPDLDIPPLVNLPLQVGSVVVQSWPFQGFLQSDGDKTFLYVYRNAFQYNGQYPIGNYITEPGNVESGDTQLWYIHSEIYGNATIRVDKVDVTALTGAGGPTYTPPTATSTPPGGTSTSTAPITGGGDCSKYEDAESQFLCKQVNELVKYLNELKSLESELCGISPSTYFCAK